MLRGEQKAKIVQVFKTESDCLLSRSTALSRNAGCHPAPCGEEGEHATSRHYGRSVMPIQSNCVKPLFTGSNASCLQGASSRFELWAMGHTKDRTFHYELWHYLSCGASGFCGIRAGDAARAVAADVLTITFAQGPAAPGMLPATWRATAPGHDGQARPALLRMANKRRVPAVCSPERSDRPYRQRARPADCGVAFSSVGSTRENRPRTVLRASPPPRRARPGCGPLVAAPADQRTTRRPPGSRDHASWTINVSCRVADCPFVR